MNARRISGLLLLTAAVLLLIFVAQRRPAPARLSPAEPVSSIPSRTLPHTEPILGPANSPAPPLAPDLRASLERILLAPGSRPNEAVLTFADAAAYQAFLARAQAGGLDVLGQLDALRTVRVRYRDLAALEAEVRRHPGAYSGIAGNHLARAPDPFAPVDRAAGDPAPFRNQTLGFLGADIPDRINWGRGVTIAVLDSGVAPDPTFDGAVRY
ncbi:MAG TPA: hypothetical protein VEQ65_08690, partial [Opitutus sp.]|nr:hypothetical protein [Opitutus sp.]